MEFDIHNVAIKNLDYSSPDCQCLIQEYTQLICKITKEYDKLVQENKQLFERVEQLNTLLETQSEISQSEIIREVSSTPKSYSFIAQDKTQGGNLFNKFWKNMRLYGWRITLQKARKYIRH